MEVNKYGKTMMFFYKSSIRHHKRPYGYENNNKYRQLPKIQYKSARRKCRNLLNLNLFSEYFRYDPLKVFSQQNSWHRNIIEFKVRIQYRYPD